MPFGGHANRVDFLVNMSASADVLAQAKVEIGLAAIPEGKNASVSACNWEQHGLMKLGNY